MAEHPEGFAIESEQALLVVCSTQVLNSKQDSVRFLTDSPLLSTGSCFLCADLKCTPLPLASATSTYFECQVQ